MPGGLQRGLGARRLPLNDLVQLFQQRHLRAHCEGILDQDSIDKLGDTTVAVGQRLVMRDGAASRRAARVVQLHEKLRT